MMVLQKLGSYNEKQIILR